MNTDSISSFISFFTFSLGVKAFLLTFIFFYIILSIVIMRQVQLMSRILNESNFSPFLKLVAVLHFIAAIATLFLAIILFIS